MRCHASGQTHGWTESGEKGNILFGQNLIPQYQNNNHKNRNQGHCASVKQIGPSLLLSASGQAGQVHVVFSFPYFPVSYFLKTLLTPAHSPRLLVGGSGRPRPHRLLVIFSSKHLSSANFFPNKPNCKYMSKLKS